MSPQKKAFILSILLIHVKRIFSSVFLCALSVVRAFRLSLRLCARIRFLSVSLGKSSSSGVK